MKARVRNRDRGFTLVEIIVTLGIGSLLLVTASYYLFSILNIWTKTKTDPEFEEHVQNVSMFLEYCLQQSVNSYIIKENNSDNKKEEASMGFSQLPESRSYDESYFNLTIYNKITALSLPQYPEYPVKAYFVHDNTKGLAIMWYYQPHQNNTENGESKDVYISPISPWAKTMNFLYYDNEEKKWENKEDLDEDYKAKNKPNAIEIIFQRNNEEYNAIIPIPDQINASNIL